MPSWVWDEKLEVRPFSRLGLHPNSPSVPFHDLLTYGQTDSRSRILIHGVESLEDEKDPVGILRVDPDPVILYRKEPGPLGTLGVDMNLRRPAVPELDGISNEVLEELEKLAVVGPNRRKGFGSDLRPGLFDCRMKHFKNLPQYLIEVRGLKRPGPGGQTRKGEKVLDEPLHPQDILMGSLDEAVRISLQLPFASFGQEVQVAGDCPQRGLEIMGSHIGELFKFGVGTQQLLGLDPYFFFRLFLAGDVPVAASHSQESAIVVVVHRLAEMAYPSDFPLRGLDAELQGAWVSFRQLLLIMGGPKGLVLGVNEVIEQSRDPEELLGRIPGDILAGWRDVEHLLIEPLPVVPIRGKFGYDAVSPLGYIPLGFVQLALRIFDVLDHA